MSRRLSMLASSAALAIAATIVVTPPAHAAVVCSLNATTHTLSVSDDGSEVSIEGSAGGDLMVSNADCGAISSIDTVNIDLSHSLGVLRFTLTNPLGPGLTDEGDGSSELEFHVFDTSASRETLEIVGSDGADGVTFGHGSGTSVNLNALADGGTPDADVTLPGSPNVHVWGNGGDDQLSATGIGGGGPGPMLSKVVFTDGPGADTLTGGDGRDEFHLQDAVADGADAVAGGPKHDALYLDAGDPTVHARFTLDDVADDGVRCCGGMTDGDNIASDVEDVYGSATPERIIGSSAPQTIDGGGGHDDIQAGRGADTLLGGRGPDLLFGGDGNDTLDGGRQRDLLLGGPGFDTAVWSDFRVGGITVDLDGHPDDGARGEHDNVSPDIERLYGTGLADTLIGDAAANQLIGGLGDDTLIGHRGDDELVGQDGNDTLDGGGGSDLCDQGAGTGSAVGCETSR